MSTAPDQLGGQFEPLLAIARPDLYRNNAFRIVGLPVKATERDLRKQAEKLQMAEKFGGATQTAGAPLPLDPPPTAEVTRAAMQLLQDPERRLVAELLWFWPVETNGQPDHALAALQRADLQAAAALWKQAQPQSIATHNLAVLYHAAALDLEHSQLAGPLSADQEQKKQKYWQEALAHWSTVVADDAAWQWVETRVSELDDPRLTGESVEQLRSDLPLALLLINSSLAAQAAAKGNQAASELHQRLIRESGFPTGAVEEAARRVVGPLKEQLTNFCHHAEAEAKADPDHADRTMRQLLDQTRPLLSTIDSLLPTGHQLREAAHDEVAQYALGCQIEYGNKTDDWTSARELIKEVKAIAASESLRMRIAENEKTIKKNLIYDEEFGKCWFCKENKSEEASSSTVPMYGHVSRTRVAGGTRVNYQKLGVKIPRCSRCQSFHDKADSLKRMGCLTTVIFAIVIGIIYYLIENSNQVNGDPSTEFNPAPVFMILILLAISGFFIGMIAGRTRMPAVMKPRPYGKQFPEALRMQSEGWKFGTGPSR